jgi:prepilin-type N-terminal cleavage/methylation domain-containing protein
MRIKQLKQKGFSLPEIVIALGLVGGISLVTMKLMDDQSENSALLYARADISKTISGVQAALNDPVKCRKMLGGTQVSSSGVSLASLKYDFTRPGETTAIPVVLLEAGKKYGTFQLGPNDIQLKTSETFTSGNFVDLVLHFRVKKRNAKIFDSDSEQVLIERIPVSITLSSANTVSTCGSVVSESNLSAREKFCQSLAAGGMTEWVPDASGGKCRLRALDCPQGKVPKNWVTIGNPDCQNLTDLLTVEDLFVINESCSINSGVRIVTQNGKFKLECN